MRRGVVATSLCLVALMITSAASAEVRALTDRSGEYRETRVLTAAAARGTFTGVWSPVGRAGTLATLNPRGDFSGDLWPTIVEDKTSPGHPWVVWSRRGGKDYDLVWSRWTQRGWQPVSWVISGKQPDGDDLDPSLATDSKGRIYAAWWRDEGGVGRIYLTTFLASSWMQPYPVSDVEVDGRYPRVLTRDGMIFVSYSTPGGVIEEQVIIFAEPTTITDDIDPLDVMTTTEYASPE